MDFVQVVAVVGLTLAVLGSYLQLKKDSRGVSYFGAAVGLAINVTVFGRVLGWW